MNWEEKIDILKKDFSPTDFRDPFTDCLDILKKIESKFIIKNNYNFNNWSDNLKNKVLLRIVTLETSYQEIKCLDIKTNFWAVIINDNTPTARHLIYDCKINSLEVLLSFTLGDFCIIDKKYKWLTYFKVDRVKNEVIIFKSGDERTPFDSKSGNC